MTLTPNETIETENAAETQPSVDQTLAQSNEHTHDHEGHTHDHSHEAQPTLNPELMREVAVEVDADTVSKAFRSVVKKYQRLARIPGFRVGKVPETVIKSRFAKEVRQEVLDELVSERFRQTIIEQKLSPVSQPQLTNLMLVDGQPLQFKAAFEVLPEFDIAGYDSVTVEKPDTTLTDAEYDAEMARLMDAHGTVEPVEEDRELVDGDWAEIEFKGVIQPLAQTAGEESTEEENEPITGEDILIQVGGANTLPAFSDALRGRKVEQEMDFEVTYPEDFGEPKLAGQTVKYDVKVKAIKKKTYPEKDEEFAKQLGNYESWGDFETKLREMASGRKKDAVENQAKEKMLTELIDKYQFPVPETFVQQQIDARLDRGLRALAQQGMTAEDMRKLDFQRLRAAQRDQAIGEVKASLILDRIAEAEGVQVTEDEMERELLMASLQSREPMDSLRERMAKDGSIERMREQMRREKTGTVLYEKLAK
jgi:trigger factor